MIANELQDALLRSYSVATNGRLSTYGNFQENAEALPFSGMNWQICIRRDDRCW
jgi:hypothetical protein